MPVLNGSFRLRLRAKTIRPGYAMLFINEFPVSPAKSNKSGGKKQ